MKIESFVLAVRAICAASGVRVHLEDSRLVTTANGIQCNGYFCEKEKVLRVAIKQPTKKWFPVLVHEYAHFKQWKTKTPYWVQGTEPVDAEDIHELWLNREIELNPQQTAKWTLRAMRVEKEAERLVLKTIRAFELPIDAAQYAKRANAYLHFWVYTAISREWYPIGREPYNIAAIVRAMPNKITKVRLTRKYLALYDRFYKEKPHGR